MALSGPGPRIASPSIVACPEVGLSKPAMMFSKVDLPHPEGPMRTTNSPLRMCRLTSCSTRFSPDSRDWNVRQSPTQETMASWFCMDARLTMPAQHDALDGEDDAVREEAHDAEHDHGGDDHIEAPERIGVEQCVADARFHAHHLGDDDQHPGNAHA